MKKILDICLSLGLVLFALDVYVQLGSDKKMLNVLSNNQVVLVDGIHKDYASRVQDVAAKCRRATFRVCVEGMEFGGGSCVLIDKGRGVFLTASHVADNEPNFVEYHDKFVPIVSCVYEPNNFDIGIIFVNPSDIKDLDCISLSLAEYNVVSGTICFLSGFPALLEGGQTISSSIVLSKTITFDQPMYQVAGNFLGGMSGGPVVDLEGRVVAIICHAIGGWAPCTGFISGGYGGAVPIIDARTFIDDLQGITDDFR